MENAVIKCEICSNIEFTNYRSLAQHIRWQHPALTLQDYYDAYLKISDTEGICTTCKTNHTKFLSISFGYRSYCSKHCADVYPEKHIHGKQTKLCNAGYVNLDKRKETCLVKYGVEHVLQTKDVQAKSRSTKLSKYGSETYNNTQKCRQTCLDRYGVDNVFKSDEIKERKKQTCFGHYGVEHNLQRPEIRELAKSDESLSKAIETKKKNHTLTSSRYEKDFEKFLLQLGIKYKFQYKCERYPWYCDFYLPDKDMFIELNFHWTHGGHWFMNTDKNDIICLDKWKEKAKTSAFYEKAIAVWTQHDVEKRLCALKNNLNYVTVWNKSDFDNLIQALEEQYGNK